MTQTVLNSSVLRDAVMLACRAPSLYNSQPWRWLAEGSLLRLYADSDRISHATDTAGREVLLGCGAALDHLRVAMAAAGWDTKTERFPTPNDPSHLATVHFSPMDSVTDADRRRADAILLRRTDRLPFGAPTRWESFEELLRATVDGDHQTIDVVADSLRAELAEASRLSEWLRHYDPSYQLEMQWWTTPFELAQGIPPSSLLSESEARRVDVARAFPTVGHSERRNSFCYDQSKIVVLSTHDDSRAALLRCGEALSAVLLEATMAGFATCPLTHMTEVATSRDILRRLSGQTGLPQVLVRIGISPAMEERPPATPRRPLDEVLQFTRKLVTNGPDPGTNDS
ncbi:MAG TPA: NAD(P)H nitroreductase [Mycobacterium sp.]|jgi:hypothetical protein